MIMKKVFILYALILLITLLTACKVQDKKDTPEVKAVFTFTELTDDDFKEVGTDIATKDDFRKVHFSTTVKYSADMSNRKIYIPDLKKIMNSYDIERYWYGQYSSKDTPEEDAEYIYDIMFLSNALTEDDMRTIFKDSQINVTWTNKEDKEEMRTIELSDIIEFH